MIKLFPRAKAYLVMSEALVLLIGSALYYDGKPIYWSIIAWLILGIIAYVGVSVYAVRQNSRLLAILLVNMMPTEFLKIYLPLLKTPHLRKNVMFQMQNYIAMAYTAAGEFNKALEMLDSMDILPGRVENQCKGIVASARCSIYIYKGETGNAEEQYEIIRALGKSAGITDRNLEVLRIRIDMSKKEISEESNDYLRETMKQINVPLIKNEMKFHVGHSYYMLEDEEMGYSYFDDVSRCPNELYITKQAKKVLNHKKEK